MLTKLDRNVRLVNDKGERLPAQIRATSVWINPEGGAELEIVIPKEQYSRMLSGAEYTLVPFNPEDHFGPDNNALHLACRGSLRTTVYPFKKQAFTIPKLLIPMVGGSKRPPAINP